MLHCIALETGPRLKRLSGTYELVWASGWEDRANDHLPGLLELPELPYSTFHGRAQFGTAHWKLDALEDYARSRPLAGGRQPRQRLLQMGGETEGAHPARSD